MSGTEIAHRAGPAQRPHGPHSPNRAEPKIFGPKLGPSLIRLIYRPGSIELGCILDLSGGPSSCIGSASLARLRPDRPETTIITFWSAKNAHLIVSHCLVTTQYMNWAELSRTELTLELDPAQPSRAESRILG